MPVFLFSAALLPDQSSFPEVTLWYPVVVNAGLCLVFIGSLLTQKSLVERLAERWEGQIFDEFQRSARSRYCLIVTSCWGAFFLFSSLCAAYFIVSGRRLLWMLFVGCLSYLLIGLGMLVEYFFRLRFKRKVALVKMLMQMLVLVFSHFLPAQVRADQDLLTAIFPPLEESVVERAVTQRRYSSGLKSPHESKGVLWFDSKSQGEKQKASWRFGWWIFGSGGENIYRDSDDNDDSIEEPAQQIGQVLAAFFSADRELVSRLFSVREESGGGRRPEFVFTPKSFRLRRAVKGIRLVGAPEPERIVVLLGAEDRIEFTFTACDQWCKEKVVQHQMKDGDGDQARISS
jgi:hypothetical protein